MDLFKKISNDALGYSLRPMMSEDLPSVIAIEESDSWEHWSYTSFTSSLHGDDKSWVILKDNTVCGFIIFRVIGEDAELLKVAVSPAWKKQGIGSMLVQLMLQQLHEKKILRCFLEVRQSNKAAIALYQKHGFATIGIRKNYYQCGSIYEHANMMVWASVL
jgi:[ribosomal protein S18]-alanine N-acetyltransferase